MSLDDGLKLDEHVVVIKLNHTHHALAAAVGRQDLTPDQAANLNLLASRIRLIRG